MPRYFLGIDGGQSSTTALIGDETGQVLGRGVAGPCNHITNRSEAEQKFRRVLEESIREACRQAGVDSTRITFAAACFGFSGGPEDKESLTRNVVQSERYKVTHDAEIALWGAFRGAPGIVVIAGTGSMAFGRNQHGQTARAGGWGYIFGDEGGAFDLVRRAVRRILAAEEGWNKETLLTRLLFEATGLVSANQLLHAFYTPEWSRSRVAQLAPLVTQAAESGDLAAAEIIEEGSAKLAWYIQGVYNRLFAGQRVPVAASGGVFESELVRSAFTKQILQLTGCTVVSPQLSPAEGALLEAVRMAAA